MVIALCDPQPSVWVRDLYSILPHHPPPLDPEGSASSDLSNVALQHSMWLNPKGLGLSTLLNLKGLNLLNIIVQCSTKLNLKGLSSTQLPHQTRSSQHLPLDLTWSNASYPHDVSWTLRNVSVINILLSQWLIWCNSCLSLRSLGLTLLWAWQFPLKWLHVRDDIHILFRSEMKNLSDNGLGRRECTLPNWSGHVPMPATMAQCQTFHIGIESFNPALTAVIISSSLMISCVLVGCWLTVTSLLFIIWLYKLCSIVLLLYSWCVIIVHVDVTNTDHGCFHSLSLLISAWGENQAWTWQSSKYFGLLYKNKVAWPSIVLLYRDKILIKKENIFMF